MWLGDVGTKKIRAEEIWRGSEWRRMEKVKWSEKVRNEVIEYVGENRTLLNTRDGMCRKVNWVDHILIRNCFLHDTTEGQMAEVKEIGRRRTRLFHCLTIFKTKEDIGS